MNRFVSTKGWLALLAMLLLLPAGLVGQEVTGSIAGTIYDSSGAVVPNATIELTGSNLPRPMTTTSTSDGSYSFPRLPTGSYKMTASATGFAPVQQVGINVDLGRVSRINFKLAPGGTTETVTVTANAAMVDTLSSASAITVDKVFFDLLPKGRGFLRSDSALRPAPAMRARPAGTRSTALPGRRTPTTSMAWKSPTFRPAC